MDSTGTMLPTVGEIARRLGVSTHQIEYLIRSRRIQPSGRAGNARVFSEKDVERIRRCIASRPTPSTGMDEVEPARGV